MSTRRKAHPDHYQTHPAVPHDATLQPRQRPDGRGEKPQHQGPEEGVHAMVRAGERASRPLVLHCAQCGTSAAVLAGQQVAICRECGGAVYRSA